MPEDHKPNPPTPDPATDIFLCRAPLASNGPAMPEGNCTRLFAHPVAGCTPLFYLSFRLDPADRPLVRRFESPTDAAAFILGMAGPQLAGIPGPEQDRIRTYFPGWFEGPIADNGNPPAGAGVKPADPVGEGDPKEEAAGRELAGVLVRDRVGTGNYFLAGAGDRSHTKLPEQDQQLIPEHFPTRAGTGDADKSNTELPEQEQQMIPEYFPAGSGTGDADKSNPELPEQERQKIREYFRAGAGDKSNPEMPEQEQQMIPEHFPAGAGDKNNPELSEQSQQKIREYFPGGFGNRDAATSAPQKITPCSPVQGCDTGQKAARRPEIPTDPPAGVQPRNNPHSPGPGAAYDPTPPGGNTGPADTSLPAAPGDARHQNSGSRDSQFPILDTADCTPAEIANLYSPTPAPDPANSIILFRSLRYSIRDGSLIENGTDLLATRDPACFWFRHWTWDGGRWIDRCEFGTRDEAVVFIREQFTKPSLFSGWNHRGIREFLPEVYGKE